jgi:carbamoyltransferase
MFEKMFVQPAAHDAGCAYGAGLAATVDAKEPARTVGMPQLGFGPDVPDTDEIASLLEGWSDLLTVERVTNIEQRTAALLTEDKVVGWVQGRAEFGPRALGNRSILADPRPARNKSRINAMIKKREGYRPFAPSVAEDRLHDIFDVPEGVATFEHMIYTLRVKEAYRSLLGAVTHVDGTARVQTVSREHNPRYWTLIREFEKRSDVPVVLNTSFNNNVEPIVTSVHDVVTCFLTTSLDALVIGDFLIHKTTLASNPVSLLKLHARLPAGRRLVRADMDATGEERPYFALESTTTDRFLEKHIEISRDLSHVLSTHLGAGAAISALIPESSDLERLADEVADLWQRRAIVLEPARSA